MKKERIRRGLVRGLIAGMAALGLAVGVSVPAQAVTGSVAIVYVKQLASVTGYTSWPTGGGGSASLYVTGNWTNHTTNSVKLTTFKVCVGNLGSPSTYVLVHTVLRNPNGTIIDYGKANVVYSQGCYTYTANRVLTSVGGELGRVVAYVTEPWSGGQAQQVVGFYR